MAPLLAMEHSELGQLPPTASAGKGWLGWSHLGDLFSKFPPGAPVRHARVATYISIGDKAVMLTGVTGQWVVPPDPSPPLLPPTPLIIFLGCCELNLPVTTGDISE